MRKLVKAELLALLVPPFASLTCVNLGLAQSSQDEAAREATRSMAKSVCATCHGIEGRSTNPAVPNLAGQQRAYIEIWSGANGNAWSQLSPLDWQKAVAAPEESPS